MGHTSQAARGRVTLTTQLGSVSRPVQDELAGMLEREKAALEQEEIAAKANDTQGLCHWVCGGRGGRSEQLCLPREGGRSAGCGAHTE